MSTTPDNELLDLVRRVRDVRRWMVWVISTRTLALCLGFVGAYIVVFSLLDHWLQFGPLARMTALIFLLAGLLASLLVFGKSVRRFYSTRHAANFVEYHCRFDQQLATAIEYYEERDDYPYSKPLAERVVAQAAVAARDVDFTAVVPKWQAYVAGAVIGIGAIVCMVALWSHGAYFARYVARLTQPMAALAPLSATRLEPITGDLVVPAEQSVELAARILGRAPDSGMLEVTVQEEGSESARYSETALTPTESDDDVRLASVTTLPVGRYAYRFTAGDAETAWLHLTVAQLPQVKRIDATIRPGPDTDPFTQEVRESTLEAPEGAEVELNVEVTEPIARAGVTGLDGAMAEVTPVDPTHLRYTFQANEPGMVRLKLTSTAGIENASVPPLQVNLREDRGPQFALKTPASDYLATNVASIPIHMDVTDERGLQSAALIIEVPGQPSIRFEAALDGHPATAALTHTLELEDYDLDLGDSILLHAEAEDIPLESSGAGEHTASDIYFIEIKPYRQIWHQPPNALPSEFGKPGLENAERLATLLDMLEYSRAILKKTWPLASAETISARDADQVESILNDVKYVEQQAAKVAAETAIPLSDSQRVALRDVRAQYEHAARALTDQDPKQAIPPEKSAYQTLRAIVLELEKAIASGSGGPPPDRDRLRLEEQVHLTRFEHEEEQWQLERLAKQLTQLRDEQRRLQGQFDHFLKDFGKQESVAQATTDESSWLDPNATQAESKPGEGGAAQLPRVSMEGALAPSQGGSATGDEPQQSRPATAQERLDLLRAVQRKLQERADALRQEIQARPASTSNADPGAALASEQLGRATEGMGAFDAAVTDAMYAAEPGESLDRAETALAQTMQALNAAAFALDQAALLTAQEEAAKKLQAQAEQLADLARDLEDTTDERERKLLLDELKEAIVDFRTQAGPEYVRSFKGSGTPPAYIALTHSLVPTADKTNLGGWVDTQPERAATWLAAQYSTMALDVMKQQGSLRPGEHSNGTFSSRENLFYEEAAHFDGRPRR